MAQSAVVRLNVGLDREKFLAQRFDSVQALIPLDSLSRRYARGSPC